MLFCHEIGFDTIYGLLCGEKLSQKVRLWRLNDKYEVCVIVIVIIIAIVIVILISIVTVIVIFRLGLYPTLCTLSGKRGLSWFSQMPRIS